MKITRLVKLAIVAIFVINSGLVGVIGAIINGPAPLMTTEIQREYQLKDFLESKVDNAKGAAVYTMADYRRDYDEYQRLKVELQLSREFEYPEAAHYFDKLRLLLNQDEMLKGVEAFQDVNQKGKTNFDRSVFASVLSFYKNNLALAFLLFGVWYWERKSFPAPLYFLLLVFCYPITIPLKVYRFIRAESKIHDKAKEMYRNLASQKYSYEVVRWVQAETEIRRRDENLFRSLTDEEVERIKKYSLGLLAKADFLEQLEGVPQHAFCLALLATVVVTVVPSDVCFKKRSCPQDSHKQRLLKLLLLSICRGKRSTTEIIRSK